MDFLSNIFGSGTIKAVTDVIDDFVTSDEEKIKAKTALEKVLQREKSEIETTIRTELKSKSDFMIAEVRQGDKFTKRARPSVIYTALFVMLFNYCLMPFLAFVTKEVWSSIILPSEFWDTVTVVISVYSVSRSFDKIGVNPVQKIKSKILGE